MLEQAPGLRPVAVYEELIRRHPELGPGVRRTLERRVRTWRAVHGPEREIVFRQTHPPGRLGLSDFTDANGLAVTVAGAPLDHRLYHFRLACSGFSHADVVLGGESFAALAGGLQGALWSLGGAPAEHRTDSLSAAYRNLTRDQGDDVTRRYAALCAHYGMVPTRNNRGESHENGAVESPHGHLKRALGDALLLRGSPDFDALADYRTFVAEVVARRNARLRVRIDAERASLAPLPPRRADDFDTVRVRVTSAGGFVLRRVFYSVPSRLVGHQLTVRLHDDRLAVFLGATPLMTLPRGRGAAGRPQRPRRRLPACDPLAAAQAHGLAQPRLPRPAVPARRLPPRLRGPARRQGRTGRLPRRGGAARAGHERGCEAALADRIGDCLDAGALPDPAALAASFAPDPQALPEVDVELGSLADYDVLLSAPAAVGVRP